MKELDRCLEIRRKISAIEEKLEDISYSIRYPKPQTMSDMPRSASSSDSPIERYIMRQEKYESDKRLLETELNSIWNMVEKQLIICEVEKSEIQLMYLRFNRGYSWKKCAATLSKAYNENWNNNKVFRIYRKIMLLLQKSMLNFGENAD